MLWISNYFDLVSLMQNSIRSRPPKFSPNRSLFRPSIKINFRLSVLKKLLITSFKKNVQTIVIVSFIYLQPLRMKYLQKMNTWSASSVIYFILNFCLNKSLIKKQLKYRNYHDEKKIVPCNVGRSKLNLFEIFLDVFHDNFWMGARHSYVYLKLTSNWWKSLFKFIIHMWKIELNCQKKYGNLAMYLHTYVYIYMYI